MSRATVLVAMVSGWPIGCGGGGTGDPDAGQADARRADASPDAGPCGVQTGGEITIDTVLAGVTVVFHDASGCVLGRTTSNAFGIARGTVTAGGMVTTITQDQLFTITQVEPGDTIRAFYRRLEPWSPTETITVDFVPEPEAYEGVLLTGCGSMLYEQGSVVSPVSFGTNRCLQSDDTLTLLALESTSSGVSWAAIEDFVLDPSGVTALTLPAWRTDFATTDVQFQNVPAEAGWVYVKTMPVEDGLVFDACDYPVDFCKAQALRDASTMTLTPSRLPDFGDRVEVQAILSYDVDPAVPPTVRFLFRDMAPAATLTLDVSTEFLPAIVATGWNADLTAPALTWSSQGPGATADAVVMSLSGLAGDRYVTWSVAAPPEVTLVPLPALPDDLRPAFAADLTPNVASYERSDIAGYAEARTRVFDLMEIASYQGAWPVHESVPGFEARMTYLNGVAP